MKTSCNKCKALVENGYKSYCLLNYKIKIETQKLYNDKGLVAWEMLVFKPLEMCPKPTTYTRMVIIGKKYV